MKKLITTFVSGITLIALSGCAIQPKGLNIKPVVKQGTDTNLQAVEYVTLIPAGSKVPFYINVAGNIFQDSVKKNIPLILKDDLYVYGDTQKDVIIWVSHDRKHWFTLEEAFEGQISFTITNTTKESSLNFNLEANKKKEM